MFHNLRGYHSHFIKEISKLSERIEDDCHQYGKVYGFYYRKTTYY